MNVSDKSKSLGDSELLKNNIIKTEREVLHTSITV
jgi:hypothetical protein